MQVFIKLAISIAVILLVTQVLRRVPTLGGLVAVMPLTGAIGLVWLYSDKPDNPEILVQYTHGALWGIIPSVLFFLVAFICFKKQIKLPIAMAAGFAAWLVGAVVHQWVLR